MKLSIDSSVMTSYKRLPYKAWYALAEFVDNSTQNFFDNREVLEEAIAEDGDPGMFVSIVYERDKGLLRIRDNALGMDETDLERALKVGVPPPNPNGRSRYGLGLKMAACWFGDEWSITTKKLGSTTEFTVTVEVEKAAAEDGTVTVTRVEGVPAEQHYTRLEIRKMNGKLHGRTLKKTKDFIGSMYRLDIDRGDLSILWDHKPLEPSLDLDFLKDPLGNPYRKEFSFQVGDREASGWIGVLGHGSRAKAGFGVIHQGRMIKTWPEAWKPTEIFGQDGGSNDLVNQRVVGELILDQFGISHTKDDIQWVGDEEDDFQDKLKEVIEDYLQVARKPYKDQAKPAIALTHAVEELNRELNSGEMKDLVENPLPTPEQIDADDRALLEETDQTSPSMTTVLPFNGVNYEVLVFLDSTKTSHEPYVVSDTTADNRIVVIINMLHPHVQSSVGSSETEILNYLRHCTYDALAEWRATRQQAQLDGGTVKRIKDQFLRLGLQINVS